MWQKLILSHYQCWYGWNFINADMDRKTVIALLKNLPSARAKTIYIFLGYYENNYWLLMYEIRQFKILKNIEKFVKFLA